MAREQEVEWRRLRADQLREQARQDAIVILPVAALEQHGPHLPVEVDSCWGKWRCGLRARSARGGGGGGAAGAVDRISEHHMSFGGTVTLDLRRSARWLKGWCGRWCAMGSGAWCC